MRGILKLSFSLLLLGFGQLAMADIDVRVGGVGCTFSSIQTAIDNANPANGITNILIARNVSYTAQAININGKNIRLIGGYADCTQTVRDNIQTVISGAGGSARSVLNISGSTGVVALSNLRLEGGDESQTKAIGDTDIYGGAIDITGGPHQLIYLENTILRNNTAGVGGALSVRGNPSNINSVFVWLSNNTLINGNTALNSGGGVYCSDATVHFKGNRSSIFNNLVGAGAGGGALAVRGNGGGVYANDCNVRVAAALQISLYSNYAFGNGGGMYAFGSNTRVDVYNVDPTSPTSIRGNVAELNGGGMNIEQGAKVYVWDAIIEGNRAYGGGGAVALYDDGQLDRSLFYMIQDIDSTELTSIASRPTGTDPLDNAVQCSEPRNCAVLRDNIARDFNDTLQPGSVFRVSADGGGSSTAVLLGGRMTGNIGNGAVRVFSFNGETSRSMFQANGALIDGNTSNTVLIGGNDDTLIQIVGSTIVGNTLSPLYVIEADLRCNGNDNIGTDFFIFYNSIVHQPGKSITGSTPEAGCVRYAMGSVFQFIPILDQATFRFGDPLFTNAASGDFTLQVGSPALDVAPATSGFRFTRDGRTRNVDLAFNSNDFGPNDLGAYEMAASDFPITELRASFSGAPTQALPGANVGYQYFLLNDGPANSPSTKIISTFSPNQSCTWTCDSFGTTAVCPAASGSGNLDTTTSMPTGAFLAFFVDCAVAGNATGSVTGNISVNSLSATDPNTANNSAAVTAPVVQGTDLALTMTDSVATVAPGGGVTYAITVTNLGGINSQNVVVTDTFPAGLTCTWTCSGDWSGTCAASGTGNIADIANLPTGGGVTPGGEVTYVAVCNVSPSATGSIVNTASVAPNAALIDPNMSNNSVTDTNSVAFSSVDLDISITNNITTIAPGSTITYRAQVRNQSGIRNLSNSAGSINGANVVVAFPNSLNCAWTCLGSSGLCLPAAGNGNINAVVNIPSDTNLVNIDATCTVSSLATGPITVTANVNPPAGFIDSNPSDNSASDTDSVAANADLVVSVNDYLAEVPAGETIVYGITFDNRGPSAVASFRKLSNVPSQCLSYTWTCEGFNGGVCAAPSGSGALNGFEGLPANAELIYTVTCPLNPAITSGSIVHSASYDSSSVPDNVPSNNASTDTTLIGVSLFKNGFE